MWDLCIPFIECLKALTMCLVLGMNNSVKDTLHMISNILLLNLITIQVAWIIFCFILFLSK